MTTRPAGVLRKAGGFGPLICALMICSALGAAVAPDDVYRLEPGARVLSDPKAYDIDFGVSFTPPAGAKVVRIWLVKPPSLEDQFIADVTPLTPATAEGVEPVYGNHFLYFEYHNPTAPLEPRVRYRVVKYAVRINIDPERVTRPATYPAEFAKYLRSEQRIVVDDDIRTLANQIAGDERNPYRIAKRFYLWIVDNIKYGHEDMADGSPGCTLQASSKFVYQNRQGHCSDWHGFFIALCRAKGLPARLTYGFEPSERKRRSPSHCRAEVYLAPYGWVNMDITHARTAKTEEERMKEFAYISNDWYLATRGTDYAFVPATQAPWPGSTTGHNPPLIRMAYIEVDGRAWPDPDPGNPKFKDHPEQLNYRVLWDFTEIPIDRALATQQARGG